MKLTHIEKSFEKRALIKGGVFLLRPDDAIQFVKACKEQGIAILGIESFKIFGQKGGSPSPKEGIYEPCLI